MKTKVTIPKNLLQPGMTLADRRYRVDGLIEDNGLTITYKGFDTFRKNRIVIRELFPQEIMKRDIDHDYKVECKRLSEERLFLSMKEHMTARAKKLIRLYPLEGIANVITYLEERETVYVIEEYATGQTLKECLWKRHSAKFLVEDLMQYLSPVMDTLSVLHKNGLFHGSISPESILITEDKTSVLTGIVNPMEDVAAPALGNLAVRVDGYAPVELYVPEAERGAVTDVYEISALFYRYVTGNPLPAYYERVNEEKTTFPPDDTQTRVMKFQSDAIMKGAAVYGFDRFTSIKELRDALQPEDMDFESLHDEEVSAQQFVKKPFWYRRRERSERRYMLAAAVILLVGIIVLVPRLYGVVNDIRINHFYNRFNGAELAEQCEMLTDLSEAQRKRYTNDYIDLDENLTDEEKAESFVTKYYDFQLKKYVTYEQFDTARDCYEYMQIDLRKGEAWINYQNQDEIMHRTIQLTPLADGSYEVTTELVKNDGTRTKETEYVKYVKLTE